MKRQIKAIALALAILTTTACGTKEANIEEDVNVAEEQQAEVALGNVRTPKATLKAEDKKENEEKKENKENEAKKDTNKQASAPAKSNNPKTGVASLGYLAGLSAVSMAGIIASRKKENK